MKISLLEALSIIMILVATSCHHSADLTVAPPMPHQPGPTFLCSHDTIYFQNFVLPVILSGCAKTGCHDDASHKKNYVLDNYSGILKLVVPFDPQSSKLYTVLFSNPEKRMPINSPFNMEQKSIIYWWIKQGAYNNKCDSAGCDSANVSYTTTIYPITQAWCVGCHGGSKPANGISLETYEQVVACANSNRLMGSLRHDAGFYPMPKGGESLSPCDIDLFQKWINIGKP